jgi:hypothetical protein
MNDKLYNELLESCGYDLMEVKETLDYFQRRLEEDVQTEQEECESEQYE